MTLAGTRSHLVLVTLLLALGGCECDRHETEGEPAEVAAGSAAEGEAEGEAAPAAAGPLGRVLSAFDDADVTTRLLVLRRTGDAEGEAPAEARGFGTAWIGGHELVLTLLSETAAEDRRATLFGPVGTCEARILREVHLRGAAEGASDASLYDALEVTPCEGLSIETLESSYGFGVEGSVTVEELSSRTMSTPSEEITSAVAEAERTAGEGEEMGLQAREVPGGATVVSGWTTHVVRGGRVLESFDDGIPAYVTLGDRTLLLARSDGGIILLAVGEDALERVSIETSR